MSNKDLEYTIKYSDNIRGYCIKIGVFRDRDEAKDILRQIQKMLNEAKSVYEENQP